MAKRAESASDVVARRILGLIVLVVGLSAVYFGAWMIATRGHGSVTDTRWMHRFDVATAFRRPDIGLGIALVGVIVALTGLVTMLRGRRT